MADRKFSDEFVTAVLRLSVETDQLNASLLDWMSSCSEEELHMAATAFACTFNDADTLRKQPDRVVQFAATMSAMKFFEMLERMIAEDQKESI